MSYYYSKANGQNSSRTMASALTKKILGSAKPKRTRAQHLIEVYRNTFKERLDPLIEAEYARNPTPCSALSTGVNQHAVAVDDDDDDDDGGDGARDDGGEELVAENADRDSGAGEGADPDTDERNQQNRANAARAWKMTLRRRVLLEEFSKEPLGVQEEITAEWQKQRDEHGKKKAATITTTQTGTGLERSEKERQE